MVDFEKSEQIAIRTHFPNAAIKGCLFHWKQCLLRRFRKISGYTDIEMVKASLHAVYGLAFVGCRVGSSNHILISTPKQLISSHTSSLPGLITLNTPSIRGTITRVRSATIQELITSLKGPIMHLTLLLESGCSSPTLSRLSLMLSSKYYRLQ